MNNLRTPPLSSCKKPSPLFFHGAFAPSFIWRRRPWLLSTDEVAVDLVYYAHESRARRGSLLHIGHCDEKISCHGNVPWAIATPFHSNYLRPKVYQSWKGREDRSRTFWNDWPRTNSKNRKQFQQLAPSEVIKNGAVRQITYDFLFDFQSNYMPIPCRFGDITWRIKVWIQSTENCLPLQRPLRDQ